MVQKALPVLPVSDLRTQAKEMLELVKAQPIIITQRGRANAVLLSYELYNEMVTRLEHLEDFRDAALLRRARETSEGVAPASALSAQYDELFREPRQTTAKATVAPTVKPQPYAVVREVKAEYRARRRGKTHAKRRASE